MAILVVLFVVSQQSPTAVRFLMHAELPATEQAAIKPDEALIRAIDTVFDSGGDDFCRKVADIQKAAGGDLRQLLEQLVVRQARHVNEEQHGWDLPLILQYLRVQQSDLVAAFAPYLDTENQQERSLMEALLGGPSPRHAGQYMDAYAAYLTSLKGFGDAHIPLIRFMYRQSPIDALHVMRRVYNRDKNVDRTVLWGEHVVTDYFWKQSNGFAQASDKSAAEAELQRLAQADQWWIRLYVAEVIRRSSDLSPGLKALFTKLADDPNELVRNAATHPLREESVEQYRVGNMTDRN